MSACACCRFSRYDDRMQSPWREVPNKDSELSAIPRLLYALKLRGALVSLEALGCQRDLPGQIRGRGADYLLAVKGNQPGLRQMLEDAFTDQPNALAD